MGGMEVAIQSIAALALFARFFRVVFLISGCSHKGILAEYFAAEEILVCLASKMYGFEPPWRSQFVRPEPFKLTKKPSGRNGA